MRKHTPVIVALLVTTVIAGATYGAFNLMIRQERQAQAERFEAAAQRATALISERVAEVDVALAEVAAGVALGLRSDAYGVTANFHFLLDFHALLEDYPQLGAVAVAVVVKRDELAALKEDLDADSGRALAGYPALNVFPSSAHPMAAPVITIEPRSLVPSVVGFDLYASPERRAAVGRARDSGEAAVSARVLLASDQAPGVVFVSPIYESSQAPRSLISRRRAFYGVVATTLRTVNFLGPARAELDPLELDFEVHDLGRADSAASPEMSLATVLASSALDDRPFAEWRDEDLLMARGDWTISKDVDAGGRLWRVVVAPRESASLSGGATAAYSALALGLLLAAAGGGIAFLQLTAAKRLSRRVGERTQELEASKRQLEASTSALRNANAQIKDKAERDELTGLYNRRAFNAHLDSALAEAAAAQSEIALIHFDLDRFKQVNDTLGHAAGDHLLRIFAEFLRDRLGQDAFIARIGGDEFAAVVSVEGENDALLQGADRVIEDCRAPLEYDGRECRFGVSVGVSLSDRGRLSAETLLSHADIALYKAKNGGRNRRERYTPSLHAELSDRQQLAHDLTHAIERDQFEPFFQPQVFAADGRLAGVEALARWRHPERGLLAPADFISVAAELGVLPRIDATILTKAVEFAERAEASGHKLPKLATNVSSKSLEQPDLLRRVRALSPFRTPLAFEVLEAVFVDESNKIAINNAALLKQLGAEIEIDDFGSGRASVLSLVALSPSRMKLDRALVRRISERPDVQRLVQLLVDMGRTLEIGVTAEGVETEAQVSLLRDLGCDVLQGFFFSRPLDAEDMLAYLSARSRADVA